MNQLVVVFIIAVCVTGGFGKSMGPKSFLRDSFAAATSSPSANCFAYYMPILNKISSDTQAANEACNQVYQESLSDAASTAENAFKQINTESAALQTELNSCTQQSTASDGLSCYVAEGDENIPSLSSISNNARSAIREYNQKVELVNSTLEACNSEVSSESEAASQQVYAYLMACMENGETIAVNPVITISTAAPTTTTKVTETTAPATAAPTTTTKFTETTAPTTETTAKVTETAAPATAAKTTVKVTETTAPTTAAETTVKVTETTAPTTVAKTTERV